MLNPNVDDRRVKISEFVVRSYLRQNQKIGRERSAPHNNSVPSQYLVNTSVFSFLSAPIAQHSLRNSRRVLGLLPHDQRHPPLGNQNLTLTKMDDAR